MRFVMGLHSLNFRFKQVTVCRTLPINTDEHRLHVFMPLYFFLKLRMAFEHAGILTLMADIMAWTLLFPLTVSDWYTTGKRMQHDNGARS